MSEPPPHGALDGGAGQSVTGRFDPVTAAIMPSAQVTHVHLLRHGEVGQFTLRRLRGQSDEDVSPAGRQQHRRLAAWLLDSEGRPTAILSSDLPRCRSLTQDLSEATGLAPVFEPRLREQSMGLWEGRTWDELTRQDAAAVTAWWEDYSRARAPGGESLHDLAERASACWDDWQPRLAGRRAVIVTHIGVIRVLLCRWLGLPLTEALRFAPAAASHTALDLAPAGAVLKSLGERPWLAAGVSVAPGPSLARPPRIALSGSAGTGKTTLGRVLARELGLPFLEEGMRERIAGGLDLHRLDRDALCRLLAELWEEQRAREDAARDGFVADRSAADYAAFWIHYGLHHDSAATERWMASMLAELTRYDRILLFPWGALPLADDGVRSTNRWTQFQYQGTLEALLGRHALPGQVLAVPPTDDLPARLRHVLARMPHV